MIAVTCPGCGLYLKVKDTLAGKTGKCPGCGQSIKVPAVPVGAPAVKKEAGRADGPRTPPPPAVDPEETQSRTPEVAHYTPGDDLEPEFESTEVHEDYAFLAPPHSPEELGRLGQYRVLKVLGVGGMGIVFLAEDRQLQRSVALKAMKPVMAHKEANRQRFLREARAVAAIQHDHVVTVYQVGEDRGIPYMAMQLLKGESLERRLRQQGGWLALNEVLRVGREIAEGLEAAHRRGLIHRDIKPANIWLEEGRDRVKIVDFGLARMANENVRLTQTGAVLGTPAYMAPEQANGQQLDYRSDLFSLGCVLYRLCTGQLPFKGKDTMSLMMALATQMPEPPRAIDPAVPVEFSDLVMQLLAKDPDDRPKSARAVAEGIARIERALEAAASAAPPPSPKEPARTDKAPKKKEGTAAAPPAVVEEPEEEHHRPRKEAAAPPVQRPRRRTPLRRRRPSWEKYVLLGGVLLFVLALLLVAFLLVRKYVPGLS